MTQKTQTLCSSVVVWEIELVELSRDSCVSEKTLFKTTEDAHINAPKRRTKQTHTHLLDFGYTF